MTNSDVIALVAIILSAVISVTTTLVSYFMNKANIQAKRSEIAFERRLEAFREIAEHTGKIKLKLSRINSEAKFKNATSDFEKIHNDFYEVYRKNLVFLPPSISKNVAEYGGLFFNFINEEYTDENRNARFKEAKAIEGQIIGEMQKFVGYT